MNGEKAISVESGGSTTLSPKRVCVLLVDGDSTCLTILSKMIRMLGYKVMTAKRVSDALCIIRERENEIDIVLSEAHLPDWNKYKLLEEVLTKSKLPIVIMSADANETDMLGVLDKGAACYLVKPITMKDIQCLWQFAVVKKTDTLEDMEDQMFSYGVKQSHRNTKRKEPERMDESEEENNDDSSVLKKSKLIWTDNLHDKFLKAIKRIGIAVARPKEILKHMNVRGLKKENISSHLQKYRLYLKREQDAKERAMYKKYFESHPGVYGIPPTVNQQVGLLQFKEMQSLTRSSQPELGSYHQKNLNSSSMFMPTLGSANFLGHAGPSCNDTSNFKYGQLTPPSIGFTYPGLHHEGMGTTSHEKLAGLHQIVDPNGEQLLKGKMVFPSCGDSGIGQWPQDEEIIEQQQQLQQEQLQQQQQQLVLPHQSLLDQENRDNIDGEFDVEELLALLDMDINDLL